MKQLGREVSNRELNGIQTASELLQHFVQPRPMARTVRETLEQQDLPPNVVFVERKQKI